MKRLLTALAQPVRTARRSQCQGTPRGFRSRAYFFGAALGAAALLVNVNVPKMVPTTISSLPSLLRSTTSKDEPTPDLLCTNSGTNRAPPGAFGSRTVL